MYKIFLFTGLLVLSFIYSNGQCNNVNLAAARPQSAAFSSYTTTGQYIDPWRAFDDGEYAAQSRWTANDGGQVHYIGIDLGQAYNICKVYIETGGLGYPTSLKLQGSNDTTGAWTDLVVLPSNTTNYMTLDNLPTTGTYRYIRALFLHRIYDWGNYDVYQFEIYNRVYNDPPSISLTAPTAGASYIQGTNIELSASAADVNGTVSKVEFYQGSTKLGEDATSPYNYTWAGAAVGAYDIYAKAIDNAGASTWTDPAHITITAAPSYLRNWTLSGNNLNNSNSGYVSIGTIPMNLPTNDSIKLAVAGTIFAKKITVTQSLWSDFVFSPGYKLRPLGEVEKFIKEFRHLPEIPSEQQILHSGVNVGENQALLLQKIEELTLYLVELNKKVNRQHLQIQSQHRKIKLLQSKLSQK